MAHMGEQSLAFGAADPFAEGADSLAERTAEAALASWSSQTPILPGSHEVQTAPTWGRSQYLVQFAVTGSNT